MAYERWNVWLMYMCVYVNFKALLEPVPSSNTENTFHQPSCVVFKRTNESINECIPITQTLAGGSFNSFSKSHTGIFIPPAGHRMGVLVKEEGRQGRTWSLWKRSEGWRLDFSTPRSGWRRCPGCVRDLELYWQTAGEKSRLFPHRRWICDSWCIFSRGKPSLVRRLPAIGRYDGAVGQWDWTARSARKHLCTWDKRHVTRLVDKGCRNKLQTSCR